MPNSGMDEGNETLQRSVSIRFQCTFPHYRNSPPFGTEFGLPEAITGAISRNFASPKLSSG